MKEIERFKEQILKEYPRLNENCEFQFSCHKGVKCFNDCCGDVNIFLTPYDILRMKNKLGISSTEFLKKYVIYPFDEKSKYPVVILKMLENEKKSCPFVSEDGCTIYEDRPWSCRMYPLGLASPKEDEKNQNQEFYFLLEDPVCKGFNEKKKWLIRDWIEDQNLNEYNEMGNLFKEITLNPFFNSKKNVLLEKLEVFDMVCYDLDKFRKFLFNSSFFSKFVVDEKTKNLIEKNDIELLKFGYKWLKFAIFGEKTIEVMQDVLNSKKEELKLDRGE
jgi:Fe-S-cluster containining protein